MIRYLCKQKWKVALYLIALCIAQILGTGFALVMSSLVDSAGKDVGTVMRCLITGIIYVAFSVVFEAAYGCLRNSLRKEARTSLKADLFAAIMKKPVKDFDSSNNAEYLNELSNNFNMYEELYFNNILVLPSLILMFITASAVCIYLEPMMLLLMIVLSVITMLSTKLTTKPLEKSSQRMAEASEEYLAEIKDDFNGYRTIRNFGILNLILSRHERANAHMEREKYSFMNHRLLCMCVGELVGLMSTVLVMGVAAYYAAKGVFTAGLVIAFGHLIGQVVSPITELPEVVANYRASKPLTERFRNILQEAETSANVEKTTFDTAIRMQDLSFGYEDNKKVFNQLTATFEKGKRYAIVGESGSGKSTLFHLLLGCYRNYKGSLTIDSEEIAGISDATIQRLIGVVAQDTFLFNDTLYNNITMFRDSFTEEEVRTAMEKAGLSAFLEKLPDGMNTLISENGKNLSGGEKQRIGLARVLLNRNPIMLLDEPTANLDEKNSKEIENYILTIPDKTIIMITHKTNAETLERFDEVVRIG